MKLSQVLAISGGGAIVLAVAAVLVVPSFAQPEPTAAPAVSVYELNGYAEAPPKPVPVPVAEAPAAPVVEEAPAEPEPSGPDLCPPGTQANSSDGYNDTSCFPDSCYVGPVSNETHPECVTAMPPYYYR